MVRRLGDAKAHAINYMSIHQATHVAVIDDETRQIIFSYPDGKNAEWREAHRRRYLPASIGIRAAGMAPD